MEMQGVPLLAKAMSLRPIQPLSLCTIKASPWLRIDASVPPGARVAQSAAALSQLRDVEKAA